jgi:hypothetical protein
MANELAIDIAQHIKSCSRKEATLSVSFYFMKLLKHTRSGFLSSIQSFNDYNFPNGQTEIDSSAIMSMCM